MKAIAINEKKDYGKISTYFLTEWPLILGLCITGCLFDGLMSFIHTYLGKIINMAEQGNPVNDVLVNGFYFLALVLFIQVNRFFKRYFVRLFANKTTYKMRKISFDYLLHSSQNVISEHSKGDILNRNMTDIEDTVEGLRKIATEIFDTFVLLISYVITMMTYDWKLTLISLGFAVVSVIVAETIRVPIYKAVKTYKAYLSRTKDQTLTFISNEVYYRGLGVNDYYQNQYNSSQDVLNRKGIKSMILGSSLEPVYKFIVWLDFFFVIYIGGKNVISADSWWLIGDFSAYVSLYMAVAVKASHVGSLVNATQGLKVSWERCKIYLHLPIKKDEELIQDGSGLDIEDLSFSFNEGQGISHLSFKAEPGEIIGVCGRVHTGKSTLLNAINGLYPIKGKVLINGVENIKIRANEAKGFIGFCSSSPQVFNDTLEQNITLGRQGNSDEAVYISHLEDEKQNENRELSRSVANLSGGQIKRLMIARAVFNKPSLIMLDNPFESIDEEMSLEIIGRLRQKLPSSVIVLTSNQKNLLQKCDKLLYLTPSSSVFAPFDELMKNEDFVSFLGGDKQ